MTGNASLHSYMQIIVKKNNFLLLLKNIKTQLKQVAKEDDTVDQG